MQRSLLVIADDLDGEPLATLIRNVQLGVLKACALRMPPSSDASAARRVIADFTGATIFGDEAGHSVEHAALNQLGHVARIVSSDEQTIITRLSPG
jgi:chaperonin GroEL